MNWFRKHFVTLIIVAVLLAGLGLLAYPSIANYWNSFHQTRVIMGYQDTVSKMDKADYERILKAAKEYNKKLSETGIRWTLSEPEKKRI